MEEKIIPMVAQVSEEPSNLCCRFLSLGQIGTTNKRRTRLVLVRHGQWFVFSDRELLLAFPH
jgi:hypothetical protein